MLFASHWLDFGLQQPSFWIWTYLDWDKQKMTYIIPAQSYQSLQEFLEDNDYSFEDRPHQIFLARKKGLVINLYSNGKIVIAGTDVAERQRLEEFLATIEAQTSTKVAKAYAAIEAVGTRIGTDEAGKGDFFGPLVIAGALANESQASLLAQLGVKDSKALSDGSIMKLALAIKHLLGPKQYSVITIGPSKYNQLFKQMKNLNRLLAWGHARAIENLLESHRDCHLAIADQFGDQSYIEQALLKRGQTIQLIQTPKAEREITVAAASILARNAFVASLQELNARYKFAFPRGATTVIVSAEQFVEKYGARALFEVAKVHFKTSKKIKNLPAAELERLWQEI
jgi:ribonuclease HIII